MKIDSYSDYKRVSFLAKYGSSDHIHQILKMPVPHHDPLNLEGRGAAFWHINVKMDTIMNPAFTKEHLASIPENVKIYGKSLREAARTTLKNLGKDVD
jgi:hypothetical protein